MILLLMESWYQWLHFLNQVGNTIRIPKQSGKTIDKMIESQMKSPEVGDRVEAKVGDFIKNKMGIDLTDFGNGITGADKKPVGDIDCATENVFIEAKTSVGKVDTQQVSKYIDVSHEKFMNIKQKKVVLYIDKPTGELRGEDAEKIRTIEGMGVKVVNSLEELKEVMELWEHPDLS